MMNTTIHPLRRWLFEHQTTPTEFARVAGVSKSHLSEILSGGKHPSIALITRLSEATGGELTANDFQAHYVRTRECEGNAA